MRGPVQVVIVLLVSLALAVPPTAQAATNVTVPVGTKVALQFINAIDSTTAKEGQQVNFRVAGDVVVARHAVIKRGAPGKGTIVSVAPPGVFGKNARIHIAFITARAVDGKPVKLSPIEITPEMMRQVKDTSGAVAAGTVGLILLGPLGVAAAALVRGGHVALGAGSVAIVATLARVTIAAP